MSSSVLVIGGAGFLGSAIVDALRAGGSMTVTSADRIPPQQASAGAIQVDVLDVKSLERACQPYDTIVNCVGQVSRPMNLCLQLNTQGIANLARVASQYDQRVIHISTVAVYGTADQVDEASPLNPETPYAACKAFAEFLLQSNVSSKKLTIVRLSNLYSDNQEKGIIAYMIKAYRTREKMTFNNTGDLRRYYLHVLDAAQAIHRLARDAKKSGIFNLIGQEHYTIKELLGLFYEKTGVHLTVEYSAQAPLENIDTIVDHRINAAIPLRYQHTIGDLFSGLVRQPASGMS